MSIDFLSFPVLEQEEFLAAQKSLQVICGKNVRQVMVFGFDFTHYRDLCNDLNFYSSQDTSLCKKVFDHRCGDPSLTSITLEKSRIVKIPTERDNRHVSKAALVNIIYENTKREKLKLELIPVVFCIDSDDNPSSITSKTLVSKTNIYNRAITHGELRRAYKLCEEFDDEGIKAIARQTFKFVKVHSDFSLEQIKAPWENKKWKERWKKRHQGAKTDASKKPYYWVRELRKLIDEDKTRLSASNPQSSSPSLIGKKRKSSPNLEAEPNRSTKI